MQQMVEIEASRQINRFIEKKKIQFRSVLTHYKKKMSRSRENFLSSSTIALHTKV